MREEIENTTSLCNNTISELLLLLDVSVLCPGGGGDDAGLSSSVAVPQVAHARHRVAQRLQLPRHQLLNLNWDSCSGAGVSGVSIYALNRRYSHLEKQPWNTSYFYPDWSTARPAAPPPRRSGSPAPRPGGPSPGPGSARKSSSAAAEWRSSRRENNNIKHLQS